MLYKSLEIYMPPMCPHIGLINVLTYKTSARWIHVSNTNNCQLLLRICMLYKSHEINMPPMCPHIGFINALFPQMGSAAPGGTLLVEFLKAILTICCPPHGLYLSILSVRISKDEYLGVHVSIFFKGALHKRNRGNQKSLLKQPSITSIWGGGVRRRRSSIRRPRFFF